MIGQLHIHEVEDLKFKIEEYPNHSDPSQSFYVLRISHSTKDSDDSFTINYYCKRNPKEFLENMK